MSQATPTIRRIFAVVAVHCRPNPDHMLAFVRGPSHLEFGIHSGAGGNRPREFAANPLAVLFVDQTQKVLVAPLKVPGASPKRACIRSSHQIESAGTSQSHVPISAELSARFRRSCSLLTCALLMRKNGGSNSQDSVCNDSHQEPAAWSGKGNFSSWQNSRQSSISAGSRTGQETVSRRA